MDPNTVLDKKIRMSTGKRRKALVFAGLFIFIAAAAAFGFYYFRAQKDVKGAIRQQTAAVQRGSLSIAVKGSGSVVASSRYDLTSNVNGIIRKVNVKDGDSLKAGDLIMELDDEAAIIEVKKLENSIAQARLQQEDNAKDLENGTVLAPISGEVTELLVKEGDNIGSNAALLTIVDKSKLRLLVPFSNTYRKLLQKGQAVSVNAFDTAKEELHNVQGTVSSISEPKYTGENGVETYNVEILINNAGLLTEGMVANAEIVASGNRLRSSESGTLAYYDSITVKSGTGGTVRSIKVTIGQFIGKGTVVAEIDNDELQLVRETNALQIEDLQNQLSSALKQLAYYKIYAPIDGTLFMEDLKPGVTVKAGDLVCSVANYSSMEFDVPVDELDIAKLAVGQTANVTVDALPETNAKPIKGTVSKIAIEGTSSNGVTTYPVTILISETEKLKGGMNANAEILIDSKENTLYVPIQGVQKRGQRNFVWVKKESGNTQDQQTGSKTGENSSSGGNGSGTGENRQNRRNMAAAGTMNPELQKYYENAEMRPVETGIHNEDHFEIISGLKEGDIILLPPVSGSQNATQRMPAGGMAVPMGGGGTFRRN